MQSQSPALTRAPRTRRQARSVLRLLELQEDARSMTDAVMDVAVGERDYLNGRLLRGERQTLAVERDPTREHREGINRERLASRLPVSSVPVTGPLTTVTVRSGATVYVNDSLVSPELAPPRVTGVSGWVRLTERLCTVPVPSPLKVRVPCVLDEKVNLPSIGVRLGLNPGGSATRHVPSPVET
jgi:hypothetical protein